MPTCPDTCPVVRAQILMEQEALRSAAKEQSKDTVTKRTQPINNSRSEDPSIRTNPELFKTKSGAASSRRQPEDDKQDESSYRNFQERSGIASDGTSVPRHREDKKLRDVPNEDISERSRATPGAASPRRRRKDELDKSSQIHFNERSGAVSDTASRATHRKDEQLDESSYKDVSGRSRAAAVTASQGKRREDEQPDETSYRNVQGRSRAATGTASRAREREDINTAKSLDRKFQGKSRVSSKGETEEEAGPSTGGSSIPQRHSPCDPECPLKRYKELIKRRTEEKQRKLDRYLVGKGFNYFDNLCTCSVMCLFNQLSRDHFVRSLIQSALLFAVGLKLSSELYAWQIPSRAMFY